VTGPEDLAAFVSCDIDLPFCHSILLNPQPVPLKIDRPPPWMPSVQLKSHE